MSLGFLHCFFYFLCKKYFLQQAKDEIDKHYEADFQVYFDTLLMRYTADFFIAQVFVLLNFLG